VNLLPGWRRAAAPLLATILGLAAFQDVGNGRAPLPPTVAACAVVVVTSILSRRRPHPAWSLLMCLGPLTLAWSRATNASEIALVVTVIALARTMALVPAAVASFGLLVAYEGVLAFRWGPATVPGVVYALLGGAALFSLVITLGRLREEQARTRAALEELRLSREAQMEAARSAERVRLAREMHDVLGHTLSALAVQLEGARLLLERERATSAAIEAVSRAHRLAGEGLHEARRAIGALRGDDLPGPDALPGLVEGFGRDSGTEARLAVAGDPVALGPEARLALYRTAQEALTNVRRHARASRVDVRLRWDPGGAELTVENDGAAPSDGADGRPGYGLTGMRERAELLGGRLEVGSAGGCFRVRLWVPATAR
jgi:signal transduction histidine kinase